MAGGGDAREAEETGRQEGDGQQGGGGGEESLQVCVGMAAGSAQKGDLLTFLGPVKGRVSLNHGPLLSTQTSKNAPCVLAPPM